MPCETCEALDVPLSSEYVRYYRIQGQMNLAESLHNREVADELRRDLAECLYRRNAMRDIYRAHLREAHPDLYKEAA